MRTPREVDLSRVRTVPIEDRASKVEANSFAIPPGAGTDRSLRSFIDSLPDILVARDFKRVVTAIVHAVHARRGIIVMLGGHVVKTGLSAVLIDLMRRGVITHLAMNGSAAIHDYEVARFGTTSEDVAAGLRDGTFGMAEETVGAKSTPRSSAANPQHGDWVSRLAAPWQISAIDCSIPSCPYSSPASTSASAARCTPPWVPRSFISIRQRAGRRSGIQAIGTSVDWQRRLRHCTMVVWYSTLGAPSSCRRCFSKR